MNPRNIANRLMEVIIFFNQFDCRDYLEYIVYKAYISYFIVLDFLVNSDYSLLHNTISSSIPLSMIIREKPMWLMLTCWLNI